jgi:uncharacterized YccA/Bax inhibitor family protein
MQTSNPALRAGAFAGLEVVGDRMTVNGTALKALVLLALCLTTTAWSWSQYFAAVQGGSASLGIFVLIGAVIGGLALAIATIVKKRWAPITAPLYALTQGVVIGFVSASFEARFPGVVLQAVGLTFGVFLGMLLVYQTGLIKVTERFRLGVAAATLGILFFYLAGFIFSFFGVSMPPLVAGGWLGIAVSVVVVVVAALNLVLDFDAIAQGVAEGAPKFMEWYGAFALMVTLIWLYLEILRLLGRLRRG